MKTIAVAAALGLAACAGPRAAGTPGADAEGDETVAEDKQPEMSEAARAYERECEQAIERARQGLAELEAHDGRATIDAVLVPLDELSRVLDGTAARASLYRNVHPDAAVRRVAEWCEQEVSKVATDLGLSRPIYDLLAAIDAGGADAVTGRHLEHLLRDFRRAGVDRDAATRERIRGLREELVRIGQEFSRNIRSDVRTIALDSAAELAGLPEDYIAAHPPGDDGMIRISTDYTDYIPFMTYAESDERRLELYRAFRNRGWPANDAVLRRMLAERAELAGLLGYDSWAAYATEDKMVETATAAQSFVDRVAGLVEQRAAADAEQLLARLQQIDPQATAVGDWQKGYLEELVKRDRYAFDSQQLRRYFPYGRVKQGILELTSRLFGVRYEPIEAAVWHPDVEAYAIWEGDELLGRFYLDMHPRPDKFKHAAAFPIQVGLRDRQLPEAALVCNFPGGDDGPGLMDHRSVETFFHEFGHLLHHLFAGRQRWVGVAGIATEWDFVEVPSQLLEEWAWSPEVLQTFATDADGEVLPAALVAKMRAARDFGKGLFVRQQMFYAALALAYYSRDPDLDTTAVARELAEKYAPFDWVDDTHFQTSFGHLAGYSSNYYTYMWSLVIAKDLWASIRARGMLEPEVLTAYRKAVLDPGGSRDAAELVEAFLGRPFSFDAFARWLQRGGPGTGPES